MLPVTSTHPRGRRRYCKLVDTRTLSPIRFAVLMFAVFNGGCGGGKVVQLGRRIRTNRFRALLPIRRTDFPMFILIPFYR